MIKKTIEFEVPDGEFCEKFNTKNPNRCDHYKTTYSEIGWEDGLGSPGTIFHNKCNLYRTSLELKRGIGIYKCDECKEVKDEGN